ncbi:putative exported protein [Halobacteriovorax marinus SJ]|uniref:Exported protein n=1 Tax=Halobacteriovorax marinus (strain ATCC BAA-682 / DSM 15412 / SJ) TaxID=862908 RepID=E1X2V1_HALMS|nr:hypothetical protein [Halobacteriovorax marinus]CBW25146.1 putative exported protein [Halobacteriovorax marinus SJ]
MKKIVLLLLTILTVNTFANDYKIFDPKRDSIWLPYTYVINGTFDVIQNPYWFSQDDYSKKMTEAWNRVREPDRNIKRDGGYKKLIQDEVFSSRVVPNIGLHFIGGSYDTVHLREYFEHHGYPMPDVWAFLFTYAAHMGNEALETSHHEISSHDHIADLYIFDLAAFIMSYNESYMNFLLDDMEVKAWHFQPIWSLKSDDFFNAGLSYVTRPKFLQFNDGKMKPFIYFGMQNIAGLSYLYQEDRVVSLGGGMSLTDPLEQKGRFVVSIFHESNGELDGSLFINGSEDMSWRLNLYPNLLKYKDVDPGFIIGNKRGGGISLGLTVNMPFGLGTDHL